MRRLLVTVAVFLMLAAPVVAAPNPTSNPEFQYVATRVLPNGNEITLEVFDWDGTFADDVVISQVVFSYVRQQRINNPAWVIIVYGPTNGGPHTDDDRIWDSRLQF